MGATVKSVAAIVSEDPHAYFLARVCDFVVDDDLLPRICFPTLFAFVVLLLLLLRNFVMFVLPSVAWDRAGADRAAHQNWTAKS